MNDRDPIRFAEEHAVKPPRIGPRLRSVFWGALGTLGVLVLVTMCWAAVITWERAAQGAAAYRYLEQQQLAAQQAKQAQQAQPEAAK